MECILLKMVYGIFCPWKYWFFLMSHEYCIYTGCPQKIGISEFDNLKSTIIIQKLHVRVVLKWFWPANSKQISILSFVKAFVPFLKTIFKKGTNAFTKPTIEICLLFKIVPIMVFLESAGQTLFKTTLTCRFLYYYCGF